MFLSLFPLQSVIFPAEVLPLHIFEPRYKQLITECRDDGITFAIPAHIRGQVAQFATEVQLLSVLKTFDNGEMDILVRGLRVTHIQDFLTDVPDKLYSGATVSVVENDSTFDATAQKTLLAKFNSLQALRGQKNYDETHFSDDLSFRLAHQVGLTLTQKIKILSMPSEQERQKFLSQQLDRIIPLAEKSNKKNRTVGSNGRVRTQHNV